MKPMGCTCSTIVLDRTKYFSDQPSIWEFQKSSLRFSPRFFSFFNMKNCESDCASNKHALQWTSQCVVLVLLDPRMVQCILQQHSTLRIQHQQLANEVFCFFTHMRREFQIQSTNAFVRLFLLLWFERGITTQEFVSQYSNTPIVNSRIVGLVIDYLRGQVIQCTGYCLTELMRRVDRPTEISDLRFVLCNHNTIQRNTSYPRRMFSGLMSRWITPI